MSEIRKVLDSWNVRLNRCVDGTPDEEEQIECDTLQECYEAVHAAIEADRGGRREVHGPCANCGYNFWRRGSIRGPLYETCTTCGIDRPGPMMHPDDPRRADLPHEGGVRVTVIDAPHYHEGMAAFLFVCDDETLDEVDDILGRGVRAARLIPVPDPKGENDG